MSDQKTHTMTKPSDRDGAAEAYRIKYKWPTKREWIASAMAHQYPSLPYEIGYEVEDAFKAGWDACDEEVNTLRDELDRIEKVYRMNRQFVEDTKDENKRLLREIERIRSVMNETLVDN